MPSNIAVRSTPLVSIVLGYPHHRLATNPRIFAACFDTSKPIATHLNRGILRT